MAETIVPILLLPQHITVTPDHLPLLKAIQTLLNESYTKTYCAQPEIFGMEHVRLADPAQLGDIIGKDGFTVILAHVTPDGPDGKAQLREIVATGSIKDFGNGDVESYAKWSKNRGGKEWAATREDTEQSSAQNGETVEGDGPKENNVQKGLAAGQKHELTAFAVSATMQARGLGARIIEEVEWLLINRHSWTSTSDRHKRSMPVVQVPGSEHAVHVDGFDVDRLREETKGLSGKEREGLTEKPKMVLMGIRELGNEAYYQRRGFESIWSGTVPVGMWDCKKECTMVYMEKEF